MIKYENQCCDCAVPAYPCIGDSCSFQHVPIYYCDYCKNECGILYEIDGDQYCEDCTKDYLKEAFDDLSITEQADVLGIEMKEIE